MAVSYSKYPGALMEITLFLSLQYLVRRVRLEETRRDALCSVQGGGGTCALLQYTQLTTAYGGPPAIAPGPLHR